MNKIKKIAPLMVLLTAGMAFNVSAAENIDGMFGYKIGQSFDNKGIDKAVPDVSLGYVYKITPAEGQRISYLSNYYVYTTPATKKINGFLAFKDYSSAEECQKTQTQFFDVVKNTYGQNNLNQSAGYISDKDNANIGIKIECADNRLIFNNLDMSLTEEAIKENKSIEDQNVKLQKQ